MVKTGAASPDQFKGNVEIAKRVFLRIAAEWQLDEATVCTLLGTSASEADARLSYLVRIYGALQQLLPGPAQSRHWLTSLNTAAPFGGKSALDRMLQGKLSDLVAVANYLDAILSGDFS